MTTEAVRTSSQKSDVIPSNNSKNHKKHLSVGRLTSATGILSLLNEKSPELLAFALERLDLMVDEFWSEIADYVSKLEVFYEDEQFIHRRKAALVVSKVYFHLGSYDDSLVFALGAGKLFTATQPSEYYDTIMSRALDQYIKLSQTFIKSSENGTNGVNDDKSKYRSSVIDPRLEDIVDSMFDRCFVDGQFKQLIGIALECHRLDVFEQAIVRSKNLNDSLCYAFEITIKLFNNHAYRAQILSIISRLYKTSKTPDFIKLTQCFIYLDDENAIHEMLIALLNTKEQSLMAYQIGFDLYESATQQLLGRLMGRLTVAAPLPELMKRSKETVPPEKAPSSCKPIPPSPVNVKVAGVTSTKVQLIQSGPSGVALPTPKNVSTPQAEANANNSESLCKTNNLDLEEQQKLNSLKPEEKDRQNRFIKMLSILSGDIISDLHLQFLTRNNRTDMSILKSTKEFVRNSICHNATIISNGYLNCGTTSDQFLRENLDWLSKAVNWAKFSATASLGVIHKRHERDALRLMASYLPKDTGPGAGYAEGGALYALGLIHANHGARVLNYLQQQLLNSQNEAVKHGACLGLGLAALGTQNKEIYEKLKTILYEDDAVIGEAAGIAMGLVMLGSGDFTVIKEMMLYAKESQHEKIQRGIAIGAALIVFNRLEGADWLIDTLTNDSDPLMRRTGINAIAMAYCGTGSNNAIRQLLYIAVSDVHDDVLRAAVEAIGFVMFRQPDQCPGIVSPLLESFNPHVRYGAAMALGIACSGTGSDDALGLLLPMIKDNTPFVRQAALISSALIAVQQNANTCPKSRDFRAIYKRVICNRMETVMVKFGAILAQGIIDAGGRNCTISLQSRTGHTSSESVVGMFVFVQFWYWFPLAHFLSLSFNPTALIALNSDLKMPKLSFLSNAKPSMFAYPQEKEDKKDKK